MDGTRIRRAREDKLLSQEEMAEAMDVGRVTIQRWEAGKVMPHPENIRKLCAIFETTPAQLGLREEEWADPPVVPSTQDEAVEDFISSSMTLSLWSLAFQRQRSPTSVANQIRRAIKDFDAMNTTNKNYQTTRREALCALATMPFVTLGLSAPESTLKTSQFSEALVQCAVSIEACWELSYSRDANDISLTFQVVSKCVAILDMIARVSSKHRAEALELVTQAAMLKTLLSWHCVDAIKVINYGRQAVAYSKETKNIELELSASCKLTWAYFRTRNDVLALTTAQKMQARLEKYNRTPNVPSLHPTIVGGVYSALAVMQAKNGESPDRALGKVDKANPGEELHAYMLLGKSTRLTEQGWAYAYCGETAKAIQTLAGHTNPHTFEPVIPQSEMGRLEVINIMALAMLNAPDRDKSEVVRLWTAGIEGAIAFQSEQRFNEALALYDLMKTVWPGERDIKDLRALIVHW